MATKAQLLKEYLHSDDIVTAVGCYDCFSAELIQQAGFKVALMSGAGVSGSFQGIPDNGLLTMTEMADAAKRIASCLDIPLIADADNGYGNPLNVYRTVKEFEAGGAAAIQLEDQVMPKKCGHMDGKEVIPTLEHCRKIEIAVEARKDMLVLARTDAGSIYGIEEAINRVNEYAKAGADFVLVDAPRTVDELKMIGEKVQAPVMVNMVEGGKTPFLPKDELKAMGFNLICYPGVCLLTMIKTLQKVLAHLHAEGNTQPYADFIGVIKDHSDLVGLDFYNDLERRFVHGK